MQYKDKNSEKDRMSEEDANRKRKEENRSEKRRARES